MGCMSSKSIERSGLNASKIGSLSRHEIELRIDAPPNSEKFTHSGITFKYAWASQRGYYPDSPDKENQDSYSVLPSASTKVGGSSDIAFFGVYDGHGNDGHLSSLYAKNQVRLANLRTFHHNFSRLLLSVSLLFNLAIDKSFCHAYGGERRG